MVDLIHHEENFGIKTDWHFHTTSHSESALESIGALFKREAARNSLLCKPTVGILTPQKLVKWHHKHFKNITILFYSKKSIKNQ